MKKNRRGPPRCDSCNVPLKWTCAFDGPTGGTHITQLHCPKCWEVYDTKNCDAHTPKEKCFACDRPLGKDERRLLAKPLDEQVVYVGRECLRKIVEAGLAGYQPPKGGPRLYTLSTAALILQKAGTK